MAYFLSYVVNKNLKDKYFLGHASLVLTEHTPPAKPRIICKVGLFESNQVELEDKMYRPEKGYTFQHKTYPITQEEMTKFLHKINSDRMIGIHSDPKRKRSSEMTVKRPSGECRRILMLKEGDLEPSSIPPNTMVLRKSEGKITAYWNEGSEILKKPLDQSTVKTLFSVSGFPQDGWGSEITREENAGLVKGIASACGYTADKLESRPGGPEFDYWRLNCKTYALSVLREVGIVDSSLSNWLIDIPIRSGALHDLEFETTAEGERFWTSPMVVSKRAKSQTLGDTASEEIEEMNVTIMANEYLNAFKNLTKLLKNPQLDAVKGIEEFRKSIKDIHNDLASSEPNKEFLNAIQKRTQAAIKSFETSMKHEPYGLGQKLLDVVKRVANYLSGSKYVLSSRYKAEYMLHSYKKQIKHSATVQHPHPHHAHHDHHHEKRKIGPHKK